MPGDFSYDKIQPLVASADVWGSQVSCTFRCPVTGVQAQATSNMESRAAGIARSTYETAKLNVWWSVRNAIANTVWRAAGSGILGRAASDAASTALGSVDVSGKAPAYSEKDRQAAVVTAFKSVAGNFRWDEMNGRWMGVTAGPTAQPAEDDFTRQLLSYPVSERYDLGILARLMAAMAGADQQVTAGENAFLQSFIDPAMGSVADVMRMPPPSKVEVEEISSGGVRESILMLCQGMALADENLEPSEVQRLRALAGVLGVGEERANELMRWAQMHVLDEAIRHSSAAGMADPSSIVAIGQRIGLSAEDAERAIVQYRKRTGMF